jgi:hypothetical protein
MNGSTENRASSAFEKPGRFDAVLSLTTANTMLPLVGRIVADIQCYHHQLDRLRPELDRLNENRRQLAWPERRRRYEIREEIAFAEQELLDALAELEVLGLTLLDAAEGRIGLPTIVNDRRAYFSWKPGEDRLTTWHFAGETGRRPIPAHWTKAPDLRAAGKS